MLKGLPQGSKELWVKTGIRKKATSVEHVSEKDGSGKTEKQGRHSEKYWKGWAIKAGTNGEKGRKGHRNQTLFSQTLSNKGGRVKQGRAE